MVSQPLEFVPLADPSQLRAKSTLRVRILFQGKLLANARVHGGMASAKGTPAVKDVELGKLRVQR